MALANGEDKLKDKEQEMASGVGLQDNGAAPLPSPQLPGQTSQIAATGQASTAGVGNMSGGKVPFANIQNYLSQQPQANAAKDISQRIGGVIDNEKQRVDAGISRVKGQTNVQNSLMTGGLDAASQLISGNPNGASTQRVTEALTADVSGMPVDPDAADVSKFSNVGKDYRRALGDLYSADQAARGGYYGSGERLLDVGLMNQSPEADAAAQQAQAGYDALEAARSDARNNVNPAWEAGQANARQAQTNIRNMLESYVKSAETPLTGQLTYGGGASGQVNPLQYTQNYKMIKDLLAGKQPSRDGSPSVVQPKTIKNGKAVI